MSPGHRQVTGNINSFNVLTNNHNNVFNFITEADAERHQILQWLSLLEPQQRHQGVRTERLKGIGSWVLETNEFIKWSERKGTCVEPVLFCHGNPGVGKTYLSSLVIDSLCDQAGGEDIAVVGLYCDFLTQQEQSSTSMLGAILKQLASREEIPEYIREAFQKAKKEFGGRSLLLLDQVEILKKTIKSLSRVYICIDALDESVPKYRQDLLESLREISRVSPSTRIFLTGRPHIDADIARYFSNAVRISINPTQDDIRSYLEMRLDRDTDPNAMDDKLRADIMRIVPEKISEIFLLVSLNIDQILGEITLHQRRKRLDEMAKGKGLGDAYAATLLRVKAQQRSRSKLAMDVLMWVSHSERPLHVDELCHALGVEEGSTDLNIQNIPATETLLACSMGLITVEKSSSTVRLVHYTLQEYLSHNPNLFLKPHSMIAEVCLTYLNLQQVKSISVSLRWAPPTAPFVEYASCYWGAHARRETTESVKTLALKLLDGYDKHISSKILIYHEMDFREWPLDRGGNPRGFTGLHGAAFLGCEEITAALLKMNKWDVQATDFHGNTAIAWAARRGNEGVVRTLLGRKDINPNTADTLYGRTPLSWAARNGHGEVVRLLLERNDTNPDTADTLHGRTPLSWAAGDGHEGVVKILLERSDVNPNSTDRDGHTPLSWAAESGHEAVVTMLLGRNDVNHNTADTNYGQTPLLWAVRKGHEEVVRSLLVRNDVNPNTTDTKYDRTPLSWAAGYGHEGVVKILPEQSGLKPNAADTKYGRTSLWWAARNGHKEVVRSLLERSDVRPDTADTLHGRTPLSRAAGLGHEGVVKILLERSDVNANTADTKNGRTPLSWAAEHGNEAVVRMLLERNDVDPNTPDTNCGRTPLWWATRNQHDGIVKILLQRSDVNPNIADTKCGQTPLSWAARNGHEEVVRSLVERSDTNSDRADTLHGRTPLWWAARNGHEGIVRILLQQSDVYSDTADTLHGRTPFLWASRNGHEEVVRMLLQQNDIDRDKADTLHGRTPLLWAARNGHEEIVRILLQQNDVDPNKADTLHGRTPLSLAAEHGHKDVVRMLLDRNDVNVDTADTLHGRTPLSWATEGGHEGVVKILLEWSGGNPNTINT